MTHDKASVLIDVLLDIINNRKCSKASLSRWKRAARVLGLTNGEYERVIDFVGLGAWIRNLESKEGK